MRLGEADAAAPLAGGHPRQPAAALLLGAVRQHVVGHDQVAVEYAGEAHPAGGDLLDQRGVDGEAEAGAAVRLGDDRAEQPHRLHLLDQGEGVLVRQLQLAGDGQHLALDPAADLHDERIGAVVHGLSSYVERYGRTAQANGWP